MSQAHLFGHITCKSWRWSSTEYPYLFCFIPRFSHHYIRSYWVSHWYFTGFQYGWSMWHVTKEPSLQFSAYAGTVRRAGSSRWGRPRSCLLSGHDYDDWMSSRYRESPHAGCPTTNGSKQQPTGGGLPRVLQSHRKSNITPCNNVLEREQLLQPPQQAATLLLIKPGHLHSGYSRTCTMQKVCRTRGL